MVFLFLLKVAGCKSYGEKRLVYVEILLVNYAQFKPEGHQITSKSFVAFVAQKYPPGKFLTIVKMSGRNFASVTKLPERFNTLDGTSAPISMQRELMRHASIQTAMDMYGRGTMSDAKEASQ
jgi:hypothetical protein